MKIFVLLCLLGLTFAKDYTGYQVWRFYPTNQQFIVLQDLVKDYDLDVWAETGRDGDFMDINIKPEVQKTLSVFLKFHRIEFSVMISELQKLIDESTPSKIGSSTDYDYDAYHEFDEIQSWMSSLVQNGEINVIKQYVGQSYQGNAFSALKITTDADGTQDHGAFIINCGIHAREWVSPASCQYYVQFLIENFKAGNEAEVEAFKSLDFYIIPVSNPDGYKYTFSDDRMWRKTRTPCSSSNCVGTDPNRNWDANFGGDGASNLCCTDTFHGAYAFSEPCTEAQRQYVDAIPNKKVYMDMHSYSQMWMYPYGYTLSAPANAEDLSTITNDVVAEIESVHGQVYEGGQISRVIYIASGSTVDYFYDTSGVKCAWAVELRDTGKYGFLLPPSEIRPTAEESYAGILRTVTHVQYGGNGASAVYCSDTYYGTAPFSETCTEAILNKNVYFDMHSIRMYLYGYTKNTLTISKT